MVTWRDSWVAVGDWFARQPAASLLAGWPMLATPVLAGLGYAVIRRAPA